MVIPISKIDRRQWLGRLPVISRAVDEINFKRLLVTKLICWKKVKAQNHVLNAEDTLLAPSGKHGD